MPEILTGLKMEDFAHPDDIKAIKVMSKVPGVDKLITFIEDKVNQLEFTMDMLGNCLQLSEDIAPRPYKILRHVCQILDYDTIPLIFSHRSYSIDITIGGVNNPMMLVSDFILNNYDDSLLYFVFGRVVARFKCGYVKYDTACDLLLKGTAPIELISEPLRIALASWMRKSELTADRGGLLACQNMKTAGRYFMNKAGMPVSLNKDVRIPDYLNASTINNYLIQSGKVVKTLTKDRGWANDRLRELNNWYVSGSMYDIIEEYAD